MADYGIKISKEGFDVKSTPSSSNKKNFIVLDSEDSHKLVEAVIVEDTSYTHSLGYVPWFYAFEVDSASNPTTFTRKIIGVEADSSTISGFPNPSYLLIYHSNL